MIEYFLFLFQPTALNALDTDCIKTEIALDTLLLSPPLHHGECREPFSLYTLKFVMLLPAESNRQK